MYVKKYDLVPFKKRKKKREAEILISLHSLFAIYELRPFSYLLFAGIDDVSQDDATLISIYNKTNQTTLNLLCKLFKGWVQCVSIQVEMNKCFLLNPENKIWRKSVLSFSRKMQKPLNSDTLQFRKNDVTEPKAKRLG